MVKKDTERLIYTGLPREWIIRHSFWELTAQVRKAKVVGRSQLRDFCKPVCGMI